MTSLIGQSYDDPPYHYERAEEMTVAFRTERSVLEQLLPPVLKPMGSTGMGVLRFIRHAQSTFGPYRAAYLIVPALLGDRPVNHMLSGMKTDFRGVAAGREVWGMPLQVGDVSISHADGIIKASASRNGVEFARMLLRLEHRIDAPEAGSPSLGTFATRRQVFEKDSTQNVLVGLSGETDLSNTTYWKASASISLSGGEPGDDWSLLPVKEIVNVRYNTDASDALHRGEVLAEW